MPKTVGIAVSNATFHFDKLYPSLRRSATAIEALQRAASIR